MAGGKLKEMVHTDARLANDDEIIKTSSMCLYRAVPHNVPLISYQYPLQTQVKGWVSLHYPKRSTTIVKLMFNELTQKVFQSFPPKLIGKFEPLFYWRRIFNQHTDKIKLHNQPWKF
jgi:hypothetical protein